MARLSKEGNKRREQQGFLLSFLLFSLCNEGLHEDEEEAGRCSLSDGPEPFGLKCQADYVFCLISCPGLSERA